MTQIKAKLDVIYAGTPAPAGVPAPAGPSKPNAKPTYDTVEKIEAAFQSGSITPSQARAYRAWITMRGRALPQAGEIKVHDTSTPSAAYELYGEQVEAEPKTGAMISGTIIDYREAWGGSMTKPVVQRLWYLQPEGTQTKRTRHYLNQTCWGLVHDFGSLPQVGERVRIEVRGAIASKIRALRWTVQGDPVDDLLAGRPNRFVRLTVAHDLKQLTFNVAGDDVIGEYEDREGVRRPKYRAHGQSRPEGYLYDSKFIRLFGFGAVQRHRHRLHTFGIDSFQIGHARFDLDGRPHSELGTARPGEFYWHGQRVEYELSRVDPETGRFTRSSDVYMFREIVEGAP